jgi:hypothetical protein
MAVDYLNKRVINNLVFAYDCGNYKSFPYAVGPLSFAFPYSSSIPINMAGGMIKKMSYSGANLTASLEQDSNGFKHLLITNPTAGSRMRLEDRASLSTYVIADNGQSMPYFDAIYTGSNGFTVETFVSTSLKSLTDTFMFGNGRDIDADNFGFLFGLYDGTPAAYMSYSASSGPNRILLRPGPLITGSWTQITYTWNGNWGGNGSASLYINGKLRSQAFRSNPGYFVGGDTGSSIYRYTNTWGWFYRNFSGYQDSLFIYNRCLSANEVLQNFNSQRGRYNL